MMKKTIGMVFAAFASSLALADVEDAMKPANLADVRLCGYVGKKMDRFIRGRLTGENAREIIFAEARRAFMTRDDDEDGAVGWWRGEFWGKQMLSAARVAQYLNDPDFTAFVREECHRLIALQDPDGYLGSYGDKTFVVARDLEAARHGWFSNWNLWGRKYCIWGMLEAYKATGDREILASAERNMNQWIDMMRELDIPLFESGTLRMNGMPSMSVLKPLLLLYRETRNVKYLDYAREFVRDWDRDDGRCPNFFRNAKLGKPIHAWYCPGEPWQWAKTYELVSCLQGLLEFYRVTGDARTLETVKLIRDNIAESETNPLGGIGYCDNLADAKHQVNALSEVCDTIHWIRLNFDLHLITGDVKYLDSMEIAYFNAFLAGVYRDGSYGAFAVRDQRHHQTQQQRGCAYNHCCVNNMPRTFMDMASATVTEDCGGVLHLNFYQDAVAKAGGVTFTVKGNYPVSDKVTVTIDSPKARTVRFRLPGCGVKDAAWKTEDVPAGRSVRTLDFAFEPRLVERDLPFIPDSTDSDPEYWYRLRYSTGSSPAVNRDILAAFRHTPAATVWRGPLLLAKAKRVGCTTAQVRDSSSVNLKGWSVRLEPLKAETTWGAWSVILSKPGYDERRFPASDYQSAGDDPYPEGASEFNVWF